MTESAQPRWDHVMHLRLARGEAAALGELYDRFAPLVHGLAHRVLTEDAAADQVTREVFARLWEHPDAYDPERGPLRSWLAELAHLLAVRRLRAARSAGYGAVAGVGAEPDVAEGVGADVAEGVGVDVAEGTEVRADVTEGTGRAEEPERAVRRASAAARADYLVESMPASLRAALHLAYFQRRDCRQTAADLGITEEEAHRRLRLGLQLLATAHNSGPLDPPLGYDTPPDPSGPPPGPGSTT
ncbi:sigma-70 family RNA polymerase sigma factor [Streptomyces sp. TS71-3]|uniref:sigma-70 family RNA polymerase sigma factor n=1 Tax=Streptomyces sp. TS71-3 TaxID=2733862 RepID=UPI001B2E5CB9|nr:sigma-70 family RNA polymerase sigma factor [Streptomyces sp. TS71-3]GHJ39859.1 RNA polymerase sigma factor [Streptomyces sp. TS71-3]